MGVIRRIMARYSSLANILACGVVVIEMRLTTRIAWSGLGFPGGRQLYARRVRDQAPDGRTIEGVHRGAVYLLTGHPHMRQAIHRINHEVPENLYRLEDDVGERIARWRGDCA